MGGKRRIVEGLTPWLPDHRYQDGWVFRRYVGAAVEIVGPLDGSALVRTEVRRYAIAGVVYERASRTWADLVARRDRGTGRRPTERQVERAARRLGLADGTLQAAQVRLEALAARTRRTMPPPSPAELWASIKRAQEAAP